MFADSTLFVLVQYVSQGILALIVFLILRRFFGDNSARGFRSWSWSWIAWVAHMLGSAVSLWNVSEFGSEHFFRLFVSSFTIAASFLQSFWLLVGSFELSFDRQIKPGLGWKASMIAVLAAVGMVVAFAFDPDAGAIRVFLRVGLRAFIVGSVYVGSALLLYRFVKSGVGIKLILVSFLFYGFQQLNYFGASYSFLAGYDYPFNLPFYMGSFDLALQALMGLGMIINMLELERRNLRKANRELDTFLYRSSHDLRAPLTTILGVVDVLKREMVTKEEVEKYVDFIHDRAQKADDVIRDIIRLRKGQKATLELVNIDVSQMVDELFLRYQALWKGRIDFQKEVKGTPTIYSDVTRLSLALDNIITNAITYRNPDISNPWVKVSIRQITQGLEIQISDNGQGIATKHLDRIFDMFYRANMQSEGSGLGLYMVREAITDIQSEITVDSQPGIGTTFHMVIKDLQ